MKLSRTAGACSNFSGAAGLKRLQLAFIVLAMRAMFEIIFLISVVKAEMIAGEVAGRASVSSMRSCGVLSLDAFNELDVLALTPSNSSIFGHRLIKFGDAADARAMDPSM